VFGAAGLLSAEGQSRTVAARAERGTLQRHLRHSEVGSWAAVNYSKKVKEHP
jgi:hypothetical protein